MRYNTGMTNLQTKLKQLPSTPGVYIFKNKQGNILYIGKAINLKNRVKSYFQKSADLSIVKKILVQQITNLETINVNTEEEALALESEMIRKNKPRFNIITKDDKSFLYVEITHEKYPRVLLVRQPNLRTKSLFFGPYPQARSLKIVFRLLHKIFPFRTCRKLPKKPCLEYFMHRCLGPCHLLITQQEYQIVIDQIINFFEGYDQELISQVTQKMQQAVLKQEFEKAAVFRDQLQAIHKLKTIKKTPQQYLTEYYATKNFDLKNALAVLQKALKIKKYLKRIEIFDISNIQGQYAVGSMVVFINGLPDKNNYRKFKIKTVFQSNDFAMMREVLLRRLKHKSWGQPNLIILDGGLGQLSAVSTFLQQEKIPHTALAKREELLYLPEQKNPLKIKKNTPAYFLLQRMRDEAHRFAITYYRKLHSKAARHGIH